MIAVVLGLSIVISIMIGFAAGVMFAEFNWKDAQKLVDMRRDAEDMERRTRIVRAMGEHREALRSTEQYLP